MKWLLIVKPPSIRLQKRNIDVYQTYCQVDEIKGDHKLAKEQIDTQFQQWFETTAILAKKFGIELSISKVVGR